MTIKHKVQSGDCLSSIAATHGANHESLWNAPENAKLKQLRKDPNVLYPGDIVTIPDLKKSEENCATESRHTFRRKGVPEKLCIRLLDREGKPRGTKEYTLDVEGTITKDKTDSDGVLKAIISPKAETAILILDDEGQEEKYELMIGALDPIDEISGLQARLLNLGYDLNEVDGDLGPLTSAALLDFQHKNKLEESGEPDETTRVKLKELYGS